MSTMPDRPADAAETVAFEGREPYAPTYCDFEAWEEHGDPPVRSWAIEDWLGMGHVTLLAAKGAMGKSVLAMQMTTALALGQSFIGKVHQPRTSLVWMGEDEDDELWRRQHAISRKFATPMSRLRGRVYLESMASEDCTLVANVHGAGMIRTGMLKVLREQINDIKAEVVVLDNIARLFAGNENDRYEVTAFMAALAWATSETRSAVLLIGHISRQTGSEFSGNAAWENAARARLWFTDSPPDKPPADADEDEEKEDLRYLAKRKVNYAQRDLCIMRYVDGAYEIVQSAQQPSGIVESMRRKRAEEIVIEGYEKLRIMNFAPTDSKNAHEFLPRLLLEQKLGAGFSKRELTDAMHALIGSGSFERGVELGRYAKGMPKRGLRLTSFPK